MQNDSGKLGNTLLWFYIGGVEITARCRRQIIDIDITAYFANDYLKMTVYPYMKMRTIGHSRK